MCLCILTRVIVEVPLDTVENEPAFLPRLDFAAHLHQVAFAHLLCEDDEGAGVDAVAGRLHVGSQVELLLTVRQVARHWSGLWRKRFSVQSHYKQIPSQNANVSEC